MLNSIRDCFVTGKWDEGQDAATLLKEDGKRGKENPIRGISRLPGYDAGAAVSFNEASSGKPMV